MADLLHWSTRVTRSAEPLVKVPLPPGHGSREHCLVRVTVEEVVPELIVLTMSTVQFIPVVAPAGPGPTSLHCATVTLAA